MSDPRPTHDEVLRAFHNLGGLRRDELSELFSPVEQHWLDDILRKAVERGELYEEGPRLYRVEDSR